MKNLYTTSFMEYVLKEFEDTIEFCSVEEMANFTFGSIEEALEKYKNKMNQSGLKCD